MSDAHEYWYNSNYYYESQISDQSNYQSFQSASSTSLRSQPSLPSVPSLNHVDDLLISNSIIHHHCLTTLKGHTSCVSSLTFAGDFLYTGSSDKEIRLWKRNPAAAATTTSSSSQFHDKYELSTNNIVAAGKGAVKSLVVLADDKLLSAHQDHKIRVWKIHNKDGPDDQKYYTRLATLPTLSDRATKLLLPRNHVQIRRHKTCTWVHHVDTVSALALSRDQTLLYSVSWDRTLKIWRTSDFKCLESVTNAHDDAINAVALSDDGDVYTGSTDKKIKVWRKNYSGDKMNHCLVATLKKHNSGINALTISLDGSTLYSGASDRSIVVWEKEEEDGGGGGMRVVGALRGHTKSILCLAVVSDLVCSGCADATIRIWRRSSSAGRRVDRNIIYDCLAVLEGHRGPVKCLAAGAVDHRGNPSHTSYVIYSGSLDCDIKVWQIVVPTS